MNHLAGIAQKAHDCVQDAEKSLEIRYAKHPELREFIDKILGWKASDTLHLYKMFRGVMAYDDLEFLGSLDSFIGNCLLDDSCFQIKWMRTKYDENHQLIWKNGEHLEEETTPEDPRGNPFVVRSSDQGSQDPSLLVQTMLVLEQRDEARIRNIRNIEEMQKRIRELIKPLSETQTSS